MGSAYYVQQRTQSPLTFPFNQMHPETGVAVLFAAITGFSGFGQVRGHHGQGTNANSDKLCSVGVLFQCDTEREVQKIPVAMHLLRALWFFVAFFDI